MSGQNKGRAPIFEESLKIAIAREYLSGNLSYAQLAKKYGIEKADTVRFFVSWYKTQYPQVEQPATDPPKAGPPQENDEVESLRKQLKDAQLKVAAYETMMSVTKQELGIDIPKKFGTKQSGK